MTQENKIKISVEKYNEIITKHYKNIHDTEKPSKIEVEKNIQYNIENGIEDSQNKKRGSNKTPKKKKSNKR